MRTHRGRSSAVASRSKRSWRASATATAWQGSSNQSIRPSPMSLTMRPSSFISPPPSPARRGAGRPREGRGGVVEPEHQAVAHVLDDAAELVHLLAAQPLLEGEEGEGGLIPTPGREPREAGD